MSDNKFYKENPYNPFNINMGCTNFRIDDTTGMRILYDIENEMFNFSLFNVSDYNDIFIDIKINVTEFAYVNSMIMYRKEFSELAKKTNQNRLKTPIENLFINKDSCLEFVTSDGKNIIFNEEASFNISFLIQNAMHTIYFMNYLKNDIEYIALYDDDRIYGFYIDNILFKFNK